MKNYMLVLAIKKVLPEEGDLQIYALGIEKEQNDETAKLKARKLWDILVEQQRKNPFEVANYLGIVEVLKNGKERLVSMDLQDITDDPEQLAKFNKFIESMTAQERKLWTERKKKKLRIDSQGKKKLH